VPKIKIKIQYTVVRTKVQYAVVTWAIPEPISPPPITVTCCIADVASGEVEKHLFNMRTRAILANSADLR
jgi:hypothetical protein